MINLKIISVKPASRCPVLRPDPAQEPRLLTIIVNLNDRLREAQERGWPLNAVQDRSVRMAAPHLLPAVLPSGWTPGNPRR